MVERYIDLLKSTDLTKMNNLQLAEFCTELFDIFKRAFSTLRVPLFFEYAMEKMPDKMQEFEKFGKLRNKLGEKMYESIHLTENKLLNETGKRLGIPQEINSNILPEEVIKHLKSNTKPDINLLKSREDFAMMVEDGNLSVFSGSDSKEIIEKVEADLKKELVGKCASSGKAKGRVKVINSVKELDKLKEKSIVVCRLTSAEFVPYFHKFLAVITEDSGILNHGAVTSREFKIPCIVGVKGATELLKDDDFIEIDADKGTIKKIDLSK